MRVIVRLDTDDGARYMLWSTASDAPVSLLVTRGAMVTTLLTYDFAGRMHSESEAEARLQRADFYGTSYGQIDSAEGLLAHNRAGPDQVQLSIPEIIRQYCVPLAVADGRVDL